MFESRTAHHVCCCSTVVCGSAVLLSEGRFWGWYAGLNPAKSIRDRLAQALHFCPMSLGCAGLGRS